MPKRAKSHTPRSRAAVRRQADRDRQAEHRVYCTQRWLRLRASVLREHPLCQKCERAEATDVDHIVPHKGNDALMWDAANLQALCHRCHSAKTVREDGGFGRGKVV